MISVIIPTLNDQHRVVACLAPLVPAAMEGLVKELIVVDAGSTDQTLAIADDAGAVILHGAGDRRASFVLGAQAAKGRWLLLLEPTVRLDHGWEAAAQAHIDGPGGPAKFRLKRSQGGWLAALQPPDAIAMLILKGGGDGGFGQGGGGHAFGRRSHGRLLQAFGWL